MKKILLFTSFIAFYANVNAQQWGDYTLVALQNKTTVSLIDHNKAVFKTWNVTGGTGYSSYVLPGGILARSTKASNASINTPAITGRFQKVDWNGSMIWDYNYSTTSYCGHHDFHVMPNGNFLIVAYVNKTAAEAAAAGMTASKALLPERIVEVKPTGATTGDVVWEWNTWDHLVQEADATKANYGKVAEHPELLNINYNNNGKDWIHANGIDYNPVLDQIVFSSHYLNEFYIIDHSTTTAEAASHSGGKSGKGGDFLYRWGNPAAYKATGITNFKVLHDAHWIPNDCPDAGFIVAFNNSTGNSKIDKVKPAFDGEKYDFKANSYLPATNSGSLTCEGFSSNMSSSQQLPNGNQLISIATQGKIYEVDKNGKTIWTYQAGGTTPQASRYAACYINADAKKPTIFEQGGALIGSAADKYQWYLNGVAIQDAINQTLTPTKSGKYQLQIANASACWSVFSDVFVLSSVAVSDLENDASLTVFPNPTSDKINLKGEIFNNDSPTTIYLFDAQGKILYKNTNTTELDLSAFPIGNYFLRVTNEGKNFIRKIIYQ
jgi:hypothetical protein